MSVRVEDLLRKIREGILASEGEPWSSATPANTGLRRSALLAAINRRPAPDPNGEIRSHRRWLGAWIVSAKRSFRRIVLVVLAPYLESERELLRDLVRFDNELAEAVDRLRVEFEERDRALRREIDSLREALDKRKT